MNTPIENQKQYTGVWIPAHVMEDKDITTTEKLLYAEIASFKHCYANNSHFAKRLGIANRSVQRCLTNLDQAGYIARFDDEKKERYIVALRDEPMTQTSRGGDVDVMGGMTFQSPIDTNIDTIKNKDIQKISDDEKFNVDKLYRGWLIEFVIGLAAWQNAGAEKRSALLDAATKKTSLTQKRAQKLLLRQRELGVDRCVRAIKNLSNAGDFYRGNNDSKWTASIEWLFKSQEKTEEWANK